MDCENHMKQSIKKTIIIRKIIIITKIQVLHVYMYFFNHKTKNNINNYKNLLYCNEKNPN